MEIRLVSGTVEMLVMEVLSAGASYGYQIGQTVLERSQSLFELKEGSLYPALHKLEREGVLESYWTEHDGRRRKYYRLTANGLKDLERRRAEWQALARGVNGVLGLSGSAS